MGKKHVHLICTKQCIKWNITRQYIYNRIPVQLSIMKNDFCIQMFRSKVFTSEMLLKDRTFRDAMRKVLLIQLVQYGKCSRVNELLVTVDDEVTTIKLASGEQLVYSLCKDGLLFPFNSHWNDDKIIDVILNSKKSKYSRLHAALFAFMAAQTKIYEIEQFMYLWMAMNGLYGYVAEKGKEHFSNGDKWIKHEYAQIKFFSLVVGAPYETEIIDKEKNHIRFSLERIVSAVPLDAIEMFIEACINNDMNNLWVMEIHNLLAHFKAEKDINPYMLILLWLPYQVRCTYFHGEFSIPILSFRDEHPLPALRVINNVLRNFLNKNLSHWFIDEGQDEVVSQIASTCEFRKNQLQKCDMFQHVKLTIYR